GIRLADDAVDGTDERRAAQDLHLVDQGFQVLHPLGLFSRDASEVPARPHAGADGPAGEVVLVESSLDLFRVDMIRRLDGQLDTVKAPTLELREQAYAAVGEGRGEEEGVYSESH